MSCTNKFREEDVIERDIEKTQSKLHELEEELRKHPRRIKKLLDEADIPRVVYELVDKGYLTRLVVTEDSSTDRMTAEEIVAGYNHEKEWSCEIDLEGETFFFFAHNTDGEPWIPDFKIRDDLDDDKWEAMVRTPKAKTIARAIASELLMKLML